MDSHLADLRKEYTQRSLNLSDVLPDPIAQFERWFAEAQAVQVPEPNAMHLATVSPTGQPSGRVVLLKGIENNEFVFYSNYASRKGKNIEYQSQVALTFFWSVLERQVRIEGKADKISAERSTEYFHSRPRGSQLGAWVSPQSDVITDRSVITERQQELEARFADQEIPRPDHWGGYAVAPYSIELWQGRPSRLHDRLRYRRQEDQWIIERLAP